MLAKKIRVTRGQLDRFRQQQSLRIGLLLLFEPVEHLLEQDALVRRVLVQQNQAAIGFQHDVEFPNHAHQAQRNMEQRHGGAGDAARKRGNRRGVVKSPVARKQRPMVCFRGVLLSG